MGVNRSVPRRVLSIEVVRNTIPEAGVPTSGLPPVRPTSEGPG